MKAQPSRSRGFIAAVALCGALALCAIPFGSANNAAETSGTYDTTSTIGTQTAYATTYEGIERVSGPLAVDTSAAIAERAFPQGSEWVIIARDDEYHDSASATGLAGTLNAPVLLTHHDQLASQTIEAIKKLGATKCYIVGGPEAITPQVQTDLEQNANLTYIERLWGEKASDTSMQCAQAIAKHGGNERNEVIVATSNHFVDALSISSYAYKYKVPVILETPTYDPADQTLPAGSESWLNAASRILVTGGTEAVPSNLIEGNAAWAGKTLRMWGAVGYDTSQVIAETLCAEGSLNPNIVGFATGELEYQGVDALCGAALCAQSSSPMLLTDKTCMSPTINKFLLANQDEVSHVILFGGTDVIPINVSDYIRKITVGSMRFIAVIGSDMWQPDGYSIHVEGSDLQMILCSDSERGCVYVVSIPRDYWYYSETTNGSNSLSGGPAESYKSNYAFHYAYWDAIKDGKSISEAEEVAAWATCQMMSDVTGYSITHYALTDLNSFMSLVDSMGGIDIDVPYAIDYDFYQLRNLATGVSQSPYDPVHFNIGWTNLSGFRAMAIARARTTSVAGGLEYGTYGLEQDVTRQTVNRRMLGNLMVKALQTGNAASCVNMLVTSGLIRTDLSSSEINAWLAPLQQRGSLNYYSTSIAVKGDIVNTPNGDAPWLVVPDDNLLWYVKTTIRDGVSPTWMNGLYGVRTDTWFDICQADTLYY